MRELRPAVVTAKRGTKTTQQAKKKSTTTTKRQNTSGRASSSGSVYGREGRMMLLPTIKRRPVRASLARKNGYLGSRVPII